MNSSTKIHHNYLLLLFQYCDDIDASVFEDIYVNVTLITHAGSPSDCARCTTCREAPTLRSDNAYKRNINGVQKYVSIRNKFADILIQDAVMTIDEAKKRRPDNIISVIKVCKRCVYE